MYVTFSIVVMLTLTLTLTYYVQLELSFSGNVLEKLKSVCADEVRNLKRALENKLTLAALEEADTLIDDLNETFIDSYMSEDQLFSISKAFRAVLIHNRDISKDLMYCLPKGAGPNMHMRGSGRERPSYNYVSRHKPSYNDKRSDHLRPQRPNTYAPPRRGESPGMRDERPRRTDRQGPVMRVFTPMMTAQAVVMMTAQAVRPSS